MKTNENELNTLDELSKLADISALDSEELEGIAGGSWETYNPVGWREKITLDRYIKEAKQRRFKLADAKYELGHIIKINNPRWREAYIKYVEEHW